MLKIWGRANSINVQKVLWCFGELGLEYERIDAGNEFGVTKTSKYHALIRTLLYPRSRTATSGFDISRIRAGTVGSARRT